MKKRIGFVDYKLENYHANVFLKAIRKDLASRGFEVAGCFGLDREGGREWAAKNNVPWFDSVAAMDAAVDCYAVLAPSNPELHAELCEMVFPRCKTTYVDKTFAPDLQTARALFALADQYGIAMQTSSALRYTNIQDYVRGLESQTARHMVIWGGGGSFAEYAIHPLEIAISCMGACVQRLLVLGAEPQRRLLLEFASGRSALVNVFTGASMPYAASVTTDKETRILQPEMAGLFVNAASAMLDLFETGQAAIDRRESLMIQSLLDVAGQPEIEGKWIMMGEV